MKTYYFDTGVKPQNSNYSDPGDIWNPTRCIPFDCEEVPENSHLMLLCDDPNLYPNASDIIVREVHNTNLVSKYAYFRTPLKLIGTP